MKTFEIDAQGHTVTASLLRDLLWEALPKLNKSDIQVKEIEEAQAP